MRDAGSAVPSEAEGLAVRKTAWRGVFQMAQRVKPGLLFEAFAKGTPDSVINAALSLGMNLRVETKYWMEQMGLAFHSTHINPNDQRNRRHG